ncbi:transcriptional repressor NrdR [Candidatus Woesearchaeota archaeon]|nr:transcriptional repressor NrdR [Candidatus Woesearchaeota archaeon]
MRCPYCKYTESKVLETRETENTTRRRRECLKCGKRYTTYEEIELTNIFVIKKNGSKEAFDKEKILDGMMRACEKRPVTLEQLKKTTEEIETKLLNHKKNEVKSTHIGEMVMRRLKKIDNIAYLRFASVYRDFEDLSSFHDELKQLVNENKENALTE